MITESVLIDKVRALLNEVQSENSVSLITDDTLQLDRYITELLPEAVLFVQMNKKSGVVNGKSYADFNFSICNGGYGVITLPEDYVRLVALKLDNWQHPCYNTSQPGSLADVAQTNRYTRAGRCSPVCVEVTSDEGVILNVYPVEEDSTPVVEYLLYEARYDGNKGLASKSDFLLQAVAYQCAGLVCNVFEKYDAANAFMGLAAALCNNNQ